MDEDKKLVELAPGKVGKDAYTGEPTVDYIAFDRTGYDELLALYPEYVVFIRDPKAVTEGISLIPTVDLNAKPFPWILSAIGPVDIAFKKIVLEAAGLDEIDALSKLLKDNEANARQGNYLMTTDNKNVNYFELIRDWGKARNIIGGGSTPIDQFIKGLTEAAELWGNILGGKTNNLKDDIGDTLVCLTQSYGIIDSIKIEAAADDIDSWLREARVEYQNYGEWADKRLALSVLRTLANISLEIELAQFEPLYHDPESLQELTSKLIADLVVLAEAKGWTLEECLAEAYNDIKDRKGVMFNGGFVKEATLTVDYAKEMLASGTVGGVGADYLNGYIAANS
ncbi:nucleotide pyrophosphohydrolase [Erwinia phage AH06]|nr:nucleotide pyrophosphohydrolase [Erwinia phage AH06]